MVPQIYNCDMRGLTDDAVNRFSELSQPTKNSQNHSSYKFTMFGGGAVDLVHEGKKKKKKAQV